MATALLGDQCSNPAGADVQLIHPSIPAGFGAHGSQGDPRSGGCSAARPRSCGKGQWELCRARRDVGSGLGGGRPRPSSRKPGSWVGSGSLPLLPRLLSGSWSLGAPASVGFFFFPFFFLSNDLGKSELGWELSHGEWERGGSCTNLGLSGRLRKQKTTSMFHHSPNYNRVKFGTSAVKTSFQSLLRLEAPSKSHGKEDS